MQVKIMLFLGKRQGAFIRAGAFIRINTVMENHTSNASLLHHISFRKRLVAKIKEYYYC